MDVERARRRLDRREAVMVVERVEELQVQDRRGAVIAWIAEAHRAAADAVVEGFSRRIGAGHDPHAVGPQHMQLGRLAAPASRVSA